ncbi:bifunctional metallophosphatase/5'-nucleotidase [Stigmatella sp. ncwal1]|uniref:Bifunctional metallophosphatase/5'-nucleotidase n=1 Tax=Stigmatella ashevillensis TaxID=2995309 RepID=A0ABT5D4D2_9BACT|nr:bifunctional metallophosphatase/5'-nucleotidase [Stigmatella ashevillena]MDC0707116.1 bifunctional metallophosphatase/5'-nucleotidase [Stigmatella ashevillena]
MQVLSINDLHGNLEAPTGSNGSVRIALDGGVVTAGGAAYLAHHIAELRKDNPNTIVVSAGDLIGASPLVSAILHDEPTIEVMNEIGLDLNAVGNHEFDEGFTELRRMQNGGCHPVDGCQGSASFAGASFKFLSANVFTDVAAKQTLFPGYAIREFEGIKVAFIGMTLEGTPTIVNPSGIQGLTFQDEADTVNALIPTLNQQGVKAVVVIIHEGGMQVAEGLYDECNGISGAIVDIVNRFDKEVDLVVSGHTHQAYNCVLNGIRVTSGASYGRIVTDVDMVLNNITNDVKSVTARNVIVTRDTADAPVDTLVKGYVAKAAPLRDKVVGNTPSDLLRPVRVPSATNSGESVLGNVIADAMLAITQAPEKGGAVIALMNPGGIRADISAGEVTYGEIFAVQPFANNVATLTLTGDQLRRVLEQQFPPINANPSIMQVSQGFSYTFSVSAPTGSKVDASSLTLNGQPIGATTTYRVSMNNFMASGGDNYSVFTEGKDLLIGPIDVDALEVYMRANNPLTVPALGRIKVVP